ncbi:transcriptional regulator [Nocardia mangyaensis]|uniref:Transcriptional regulator n=1 Tax=Nocardia mangyaensis TaxID=2213200 RepID=A0A1J0W003_9NOCA|nr:helix-turn-helix domain-containing protein [Nocardia mangyaensis]APE37644.1 transcriptional regulator [Nocardia mangyaensis]
MAESSALSVYLRERRMAAGLARAELAVRAQMAPLLITQIEAGTLVPNPPMLQRLFDSLDVPQWYRKHILVLGLPSVESGPPATAPSAEDLADLASLTHPACFQRFPTMDVLAANADYQRLFPGMGAGVNMLQWMFLNQTAKEVFVDWTTEAQLLVHAFRMLSPLAPSHRVSAIAEACGRSPDWDEIWASDVRPQDIARRHIRLREPGTTTERRMLLRVYDPAFPTRPWWLYRLIPTR